MYHFLKDEYDSVLFYSSRVPYFTINKKYCLYADRANWIKQKKLRIRWKAFHLMIMHFKPASLYAWIGEKQKAIEKLNLAYRLYDFGLISIKVDKLFDPLRNEEGFKELLRKMGME